MSYRYSVDRRFFYKMPKPQFGEILNANYVISRDVNKDRMVPTQSTSDVKNLSKTYPNKKIRYNQGFWRKN